MTTNKHLARGIAIVDGKEVFVYGYYYKNEISGRMTITWIEKPEKIEQQKASSALVGKRDKDSFFTINSACERCKEIISEPDLCLGIEDINGKMIFEKDEGYIGDEKYVVKYDEKQCCFILDSEKTTERYLTKSTVDNYSFKITGNTYGIDKEGE